MNITVICVGKLKEKYLKDAIIEYTKRLSKYCKLQIIELNDEKTPFNASEKEEEIIKEKEGNNILKHIRGNMHIIALAIEGKMLTSEEFVDYIETQELRGNRDIAFIIGGSLGLSKEVLNRADYKLSFSRMTFLHQLMRVILLEQVYRAFEIINKDDYKSML